MKPGMRRFLLSKFLLVPLAALLLFTLAGFILAPLLIRWYIPKYTREQLKCQANLGTVRLNPFLLRFEANDFTLNGPDGAPLVSFGRLYLDCELTGFFYMAIHLKEVRLEKPSVNLAVESDGSLNFAILAPKPSEVKAEEPSKSKPLRLILGSVTLEGGELAVTDKRPSSPAVLNFHNLDLELKTLTTLVDDNGTYSLVAGTPDGETVAWQGRLSLIPFRSDGKIACSGIRTASLWKFLQNAVNLEEPKGRLGLSADYQLSTAETPLQLTFENFRVDLSDVGLKLANDKAPFFELNRFDIDSARFDLASRELQINRFLVDGGVLHIDIDEAGRSNLERVLRSKPSAEGKESVPAEPDGAVQSVPAEGAPWKVRVAAFEIKGMACDVQDLSRSLPMSAGASNISIRSQATIEAGVQAQITVKKIVTELQGVHFGIKAAPKPLFAARRLLLEEGELDLGAHTFSIARIGLSEGHLDVGLDRQGKINWQQLLTLKGTGAAQEKPQAATAAAQSTAANPAPAKEAPWKIDVGSVDIKDMAFGLVDLSRSVPVTAGIAAISIGLKANVEAGNELQVAVKEISTELKGLQLGTTGSPKALFEAQKFLLEGGDVDLGAKTLKVARINVSDGYFDVARDRDGKINWTELFAAKDNPSVQTEPQPASGQPSQWKFLLKSFELDNFRSEVMDQTAHAEKPLFQLQDLQVRISEIDGKSPMDLQVGFGLQQGGKVALRGKVDPASPSVEANINLAGVDLALAQPYIEPFITLTLDSAALSLDGVLRYGTPAKGPKISYEGSFGIDRLSLNQPGSKETYLGWDALQIPKMKVELERNRLQVDEITISQPVGQLIIAEDGSVNLAKILKEQPDTGRKTEPTKPQSKGAARKGSRRSAAKPAESGDSFPFSIGKVKIKDGNMVFADLSLTPKFMTRIHALKGTVGKLSSEKRTLSQVKLDGRVDQYGMVKISGTLDVNDFKRTTDITMAFRNVEMANISPYSGRFAGRRIKSGKLSLDLKYNIKNNKLAGDNKIIVDNLVLGEKVESPDAMNLPLDLAIALLSDSNGRIDLGLPVSGELNDPQFSIGAIIWKTLANIIVKAATAPFRALGSLLGGGAEKFDAVEFEPGKAELLPPEKEKLKKVAEALQKRPQLRLVVHGQYSPELDGLELKRLFVSRAVDARMGVQPKADDDLEPLDFSDSKVRDALEKLYTERFGPKALDEIKRAVKEGEIKPREDAGDKQKARKKGKGLGRLWTSMKLYKIVPGAMSPEQSELLAVELFARLVESDPNPEQALAQLADDRARAITAELESANAVPADRLQIGDVQPFAQEAGLSAKLSLDAVAAAN